MALRMMALRMMALRTRGLIMRGKEGVGVRGEGRNYSVERVANRERKIRNPNIYPPTINLRRTLRECKTTKQKSKII